jgi:hypothetical protein
MHFKLALFLMCFTLLYFSGKQGADNNFELPLEDE